MTLPVTDRVIEALTARYGNKLPPAYHLRAGYAVLGALRQMLQDLDEQRRVARAFGLMVMPTGYLYATRSDPDALVVLDGPPGDDLS